MTLAWQLEWVDVDRFARKPFRLHYDRIKQAAAQGGQATVTFHEGDSKRFRLGEHSASFVAELHRIVASVTHDSAPLPELGALRERLIRITTTPGFWPMRLLDCVLVQALSFEASDVHFEASGAILLRRSGSLYPIAQLEADMIRRVIACAKLRSGLKTWRYDELQEGRLEVAHVDARISVLPTVGGEQMAVRLPDRRVQSLELSALGFENGLVESWAEYLNQSAGLLLVAGASGSGKTTTAYASLRHIVAERGTVARVATVEDPVEARLDGVQQVGVGGDRSFTPADALAHLLRQDMDVLLVGEIRDPQSARLAVQAAQTGHLVVATVHARDGAEAIARLIELGVPADRLADGLLAVLDQQLTRLRCACPQEPDCPRCLGVGFDGRIGRGALLRCTSAVRATIAAGGARDSICAAATPWAPIGERNR